MGNRENLFKISILNTNKFIENLPENLRGNFFGILCYDKKGYGYGNAGLTFSMFGEQIKELENRLTINFDELNSAYVGKECKVYLNNIAFSGTIYYIGE